MIEQDITRAIVAVEDVATAIHNVANAIRDVFGSKEVGDALEGLAGICTTDRAGEQIAEALDDMTKAIIDIAKRFSSDG